ncbi:MAG: hypothetical protein PHN75_09875, partial [Syntrophales bacterium]|nr:hypothetical protein [Syntrophales bacterium]
MAMTITFNPSMSEEQYKDRRWDVILWTEESGKLKTTPYKDSKGYATIGAGFKIDSNWKEILNAMQFDTSDDAPKTEKDYIQKIKDLVGTNRKFTSTSMEALTKSLNDLMAKRATDIAVPGTNKRRTFTFNDDNEIKATFQNIVLKYEDQLSRWLGGIPLSYSYERTVLLSLTYNNLIGFTTDRQGNTIRKSGKLWTAFNNGNRAEAWFEIRYDSNGGDSRGPGIAKRRFYESELFGLYNDSQNVTLDDAKQVYRMLENHRSRIIEEESLFGIAMSDGITRGTWQYKGKTALEMANSDYPTLFADGKVDSLESSLTQAYHQIFIWLQSQYPNALSGKTESSFKSYNILLDEADPSVSPNHAATLDARLLRSGIEQTIDNILIGEGGDDKLRGGKGNDILIGGEGNDIYFYRSGDGDDLIADSDNKGRIIIENQKGQAIETIGLGNLYKKGDTVWSNGSGSVRITHNSPWKIVLE